ncbi:DUF2993 domain-containing protein [Kovacikia minuta CCNUW1]|uniref:LmeA family phospholipid-binding protein n=1 Tax=Kovacikia minuta TaxID=2931930 RepID=UPI001CCC60BA|nr:DUF2993 domain-containing protein [Kovacikia minuta]UBF28459.1 DUF2993 domain-containing protein [Kovacikia minuta CCNUW1]
MSKQSRVITTVLTPAVRFWLRSQLEQVEDLQLMVEAGDREILGGCIRRVSVSAQKAVYRGLYLSQVSILGEQIRTNLRQVLRGQPLRLLEAFPIAGDVLISEADLNASLQAPLLGDAVANFLLSLLSNSGTDCDRFRGAQALHLQDPKIAIQDGKLTFTATLTCANELDSEPLPIILWTGLLLENNRLLRLHPLRWQRADKDPPDLPQNHPTDLAFDLGSEVSLEELTLETGQIRCRGQIRVTPEEE